MLRVVVIAFNIIMAILILSAAVSDKSEDNKLSQIIFGFMSALYAINCIFIWQ